MRKAPAVLVTFTLVFLAACGPPTEPAPIRVSGSYWIELSPVIVAADRFYPQQLGVGEGGITRITAGEADLATNAETQLLRESLVNPDLRIIMTVTESFYRLVGRRSAGIDTLADLRGKRIMVPRNTSANYYLVAMLEAVGLTEDDVELVALPQADDVKASMELMSDALLRGEADVISIWEPEPDDAIRQLGDDAIVFQDRSVYREVFNLHTTATALTDPDRRRSVVAFVRAVADASEALKRDPEAFWPHISNVIGYSEAQIEAAWSEMEFPVRIIPDMLDVLEKEEVWVAKERGREPRSREVLAQFIDTSVVEEALADGGPIVIERQGAFAVGGTVLGDPVNASIHCDHGVVEFQIPPSPRAVNLLMWHSASALAWQQRWDGGEGFQSLFLRRGFPVYLWDGPRVGRADWGCADSTYSAETGRDQSNFIAWRFGVEYPRWFEGVQFPIHDAEAWNQATRARYQEYDTVENAELQSLAAAELVARIGPTVALTNSAGGLRALLTALKSDNMAGIVMYENVGFVFPEGGWSGETNGPFGPVVVPLDEFRKLTRIPLQVVWGDNVDQSPRQMAALDQSKRFIELVNEHGGNAELLMLRDAGLVGNTHIPFADMNNLEVADLLSKFLRANGLDGYVR